MEELFDKELRELVKFTDATQKPTSGVETEKKEATKEHSTKEKNEHKAAGRFLDAEREPAKTFFLERAFSRVKYPAVFIALEYLFFYWQQTGQIQESAAMPSMIVCALLAGISVGKNWKWRNF